VSLRRLATHDELLAAAGGSPFIRYDIPAPLEHPAWTLGSAVRCRARPTPAGSGSS
jgi:hypothetical protein